MNVPFRRAVDKRLSAVYRPVMVVLLGLLLSLFVSLSSCTNNEIPSVDRENLFSLSIGRMEDQVDLFGLEGRQSSLKTRIAMRDGIFYISDGNGAKVVQFTSYGDLLSMIYDSESNPPLLSLKPDSGDSGVVTRRAVAYPLNQPGELAIDSRKHLYVEDRLPQERRNFDADKRALLDELVLHFGSDGRFIEYLGQEGVGGTPFPLISSINISSNDEVAVVCRISTAWNIYWFDIEGNPLYVVRIANDELPQKEGNSVRPSLDGIAVAPDARRLYLKVDYYRETVDESTNTRAGIGYDGSLIWVMNVEDGSYTETIEVPVLERTETENDKKVVSQRIYSLVGSAKGGKIFLSSPDQGGYALLLLQTGSREQKRGFIRVDDEELKFNAFHLSSDGILSALLASEFETKVVWWRTDRLVGEPHR